MIVTTGLLGAFLKSLQFLFFIPPMHLSKTKSVRFTVNKRFQKYSWIQTSILIFGGICLINYVVQKSGNWSLVQVFDRALFAVILLAYALVFYILVPKLEDIVHFINQILSFERTFVRNSSESEQRGTLIIKYIKIT